MNSGLTVIEAHDCFYRVVVVQEGVVSGYEQANAKNSTTHPGGVLLMAVVNATKSSSYGMYTS